MTELPQMAAPRCMFLASKALAVHGEAFENDPDYLAGLSDMWCGMTARGLGPDQADVGLTPCSNRERSCYREY